MRGLVQEIACARPATVEELKVILAAAPKAMLIAGGTDVMVRLEAGAPLPPEGGVVFPFETVKVEFMLEAA